MKHTLNCTGYHVNKLDMVKGQGCYLYDIHGNRYIDFEAGIWCTSLGHNHRRVNEAIKAQFNKISHLGFSYRNPTVEDTAVKVLETVQLIEGKCLFLSSGSEAVEFAVQIARRITGKPLMLTFTQSYLAAYGSAGRKSPEEWYLFDWSPCNACPQLEGCSLQCPHLRAIPFELIGALVFEPGSTSGLVKFPPKQLVKTLGAMMKKQQGLIVVNEITTGFGRTGAWHGFQHYDLKPDIIAMGKGMGNGYPVSAVVMRGDMADKLKKDKFSYAQSHQNDALGCVIAKEVINVIQEEGLIERSSHVGKNFLNALKQLKERHHTIKEIRGRGLMIALEFNQDHEQFSLESLYSQLLGRGFIVGYKPTANLLRFYPALIINEDDIMNMLETMDEILESCTGSGATISVKSPSRQRR